MAPLVGVPHNGGSSSANDAICSRICISIFNCLEPITLVADGETLSKSPKATICHRFLAIVAFILSIVYVCMQALSRQI